MKTWTRYPFVRLVIPLLAGIILHRLSDEWPDIPIWLVFVPLAIIPLRNLLNTKSAYAGRWIYGLLVNLFLIIFGFLLADTKAEINHRNHFTGIGASDIEAISAIVADEPAERANSIRFTVKSEVALVNGLHKNVKGRIMVYVSKDSAGRQISYGDRIIFSEQPFPIPGPGNPGEFNYAAYLANKGIHHQVFLKSGRYEVIHNVGGNFLQKFAYQVRNGFLTLFRDAGIDGREYALAAALLIGYGDLLDADQRKEFAGAGAMHILCVSGLHVGIIFLLADKLFFFLRKRKNGNWLRPVLILLVIWFYALITGLAPSVMRASLMFSLVTIGGALNRKSHIINSVAASAFILLLIQPSIIFELGFQLSYAAVLGIVILQPHLQKLFVPANKFQKYLWDIITVSLAAQIATGPISLMYFHQFPSYFLLTNLLVIPLAGVLIYSGLAFIILSKIPVVAGYAATLLVWEFKFLNTAVGLIEGLPGAVVRNIYLPWISTFLVYLVILMLFAWYLDKKRIWFRMGVAFLILFLAGNTYRNTERITRHELVVHHIRSHTAISLVHGQQHLLFADSALMSSPEKLSYPLEGYIIEKGMKPFEMVEVTSSFNNEKMAVAYKGFILAGGTRIAIVSDKNCLPETGKQINVDYVVLRSNAYVTASELISAFPGALFIMDASSSKRRTMKWQEDFSKENIPFYSVYDKGAMIIEL
ncbi:MAG: ComEC family competence protein [Lentimicrobium sp.]|nr:ComEC family competence protein [Lentimicrobium sp.]